MAINRHPISDPAAINDPLSATGIPGTAPSLTSTPSPPPPGTGPASGPGTGTGSGSGPPIGSINDNENTNTPPDNIIIPPSADIIPLSPQPPNNKQNNTPDKNQHLINPVISEINHNNNKESNNQQINNNNDLNNNNNNNNQTNLNNINNNDQTNLNNNNNNDLLLNPNKLISTTEDKNNNSSTNNLINNNINPTSTSTPTSTPTPTPTFIPTLPNNKISSTTNSPLSIAEFHPDNAVSIQPTPRDPPPTPRSAQQQDNHNDSNTGTSLGTIMGILVAAVIGAIVLAGILAMIKRRKKANQPADYPDDLFNEKPLGYHHDSDRRSLDSASAGLPMSPGANRKPRAEALYGPRPPSIIERHQASPAVPGPLPSYPPGPMPSYQPGQILDYSNHAHHFSLRRPKPPTYHSPYGDQPSDLAYANHPPIDPAMNSGAGQLNQNFINHGMNYDQSPNLPEQHGDINMAIQSPIPYPPAARGEQYATYTQHAMANSNSTPSYSQLQVDQLDFFGHPSPATTMVGSVPVDWNSSQSCEKSFNTDHAPIEGSINVATGIAVTDTQNETKPSPLALNLPQNYLGCLDPGAQDIESQRKNPEDPSGGEKLHDASIPNLEQSFLDCYDRASQDVQLEKKEGLHAGGEGIEMDDLGNANKTKGTTTVPGGGLDWKLASPKLTSSLGDLFENGLVAYDHVPIDHAVEQHHSPIPRNETPTQPLKVINH